jgi:hypothetical protein
MDGALGKLLGIAIMDAALGIVVATAGSVGATVYMGCSAGAAYVIGCSVGAA